MKFKVGDYIIDNDGDCGEIVRYDNGWPMVHYIRLGFTQAYHPTLIIRLADDFELLRCLIKGK